MYWALAGHLRRLKCGRRIVDGLEPGAKSSVTKPERVLHGRQFRWANQDGAT